MRHLLSVPAMRPPGSPRTGVPGRLHREAAGERPPRARPQRRGSPGPIPNPAVKPAFAESTAAQGCGRAGRRARGGRFSMLARFRARGDARRRAACAGRGPQGDVPLRPFSCVGRHCPAGCRDRRRGLPSWPVDCTGAPQARLGLRGDSSRVFYLDLRVAFALLVFCGTFSSAVLLRIVSRFRWSFPFLGLLAIVLVGLIRHTNCLAR